MTDALQNLLRKTGQALKDNRFADAGRDASEALLIVRRDGSRAELAMVLRGLAEIERKLHQVEVARQHYEEAVAIHREEGSTLRLAHTIRHLGDVHQHAGRADLAQPCYDEALAIYRADPKSSRLDLANTIRSMAVLQGEAGEGEQASRLWEEAKELYASVNVVEGVAESAIELALLARKRRDTERARQWLSEASAAAEVSGDPATQRRVRKYQAIIGTGPTGSTQESS